MTSRFTLAVIFSTLIFCPLMCGCGSRKIADYVPTASLAREALNKSLEAWKENQPVGLIAGKPGVQVVDSKRQPGQALDSYEVLGELSESGGRRFSVEVRLSNPVQVEKIDYIVMGIDPLWVVRKEDYNVFGHWEHNMPDSGE